MSQKSSLSSKKKRRKGYQRQKYHTSLLSLLRIDRIQYSKESPEVPSVDEEDLENPFRGMTEEKWAEQETARKLTTVPTYPKPKLVPNARRNMARKLRVLRDQLLYATPSAKARGKRRNKAGVKKGFPTYLHKRQKILDYYMNPLATEEDRGDDPFTKPLRRSPPADSNQ